MSINGDEGIGYVESLENNFQDIIDFNEAMVSHPEIEKYVITHKAKNRYWNKTKHNINYHSISETILETGSLMHFPIIIEKGKQHHNILSPDAKSVQDLFKLLDERFSKTEIKHLSSIPIADNSGLLTAKQMEAVEIAIDMGYYEIPRRHTIEQISSQLRIKRVAMQERLRRAENKIMKSYYLNLFS